MKLISASLVLTLTSTALVPITHAWVADIYVKSATIPPGANARLTPEEWRQLFHMDEQKAMPRKENSPYTFQDRAQLWHLQDPPFPARGVETTARQPYTFQDRAALWKLDDVQQSQQMRQTSSSSPTRLSATDYEQLWNLQDQAKLHPTEPFTPPPYTSEERAELWSLHQVHDKMTMQKPRAKWNLLTDQDRRFLWHMDDVINGDKDETSREPYTDADRELLFHLDDHSKMLHDETERQIYTDQDRAELWHISEEDHTSKGSEAPYLDEERAELWHLNDSTHEGEQRRSQEADNEPYTDQDRRVLWNL